MQIFYCQLTGFIGLWIIPVFGSKGRDMAVGIPGVDEQSFANLFEGDMELFVSILNTFIGKTPGVVNSLRTVSQATLGDYANKVHGLKGACANICAEEARKTASKLEMMAKAGDLSGVLANNEGFLKYMDNLLKDLQKWLKDRQG
jgi:HPt (histidine-containing phosphotransfer) domain-containing protein